MLLGPLETLCWVVFDTEGTKIISYHMLSFQLTVFLCKLVFAKFKKNFKNFLKPTKNWTVVGPDPQGHTALWSKGTLVMGTMARGQLAHKGVSVPKLPLVCHNKCSKAFCSRRTPHKHLTGSPTSPSQNGNKDNAPQTGKQMRVRNPMSPCVCVCWISVACPNPPPH